MKRSFALSLCAVALTAFTLSDARADDIDIDLEFGNGSWTVYAEVIDTAGAADGSLGLSAVRILLDNVDFGTNGDAVTIASDIGAINPVDAGGPNERLPVLDLGGTLDILYGQDISTSGTIVGGVGVGGRAEIASGTYSGADPAFGTDGALTTQGLFLTSTTPGAGNAIDPDANNLTVTALPDGPFGDFEPDGDVDINDFGVFAAAFGSSLGDPNYNADADAEPDNDVDINDFGAFAANFGFPFDSVAATSAVPEPASALLALSALAALCVSRRRNS